MKAFGNGPANPAASPLVPAELRRVDPGYPDNAKVQLPIFAEWYGDNQGRMLNQFIDLVHRKSEGASMAPSKPPPTSRWRRRSRRSNVAMR